MIEINEQNFSPGHPNARLFICHGGLMGIQESVYHRVPVLGLPLGRDQYHTMAKAVVEGYAMQLEWHQLTETILYDAIDALLQQSKFVKNCRPKFVRF